MSSSLSHTFSPSRPSNDGNARYPVISRQMVDYIKMEIERIRESNEREPRPTVSHHRTTHGKDPAAR
jgi:hypothetical protein